ncbi:MAG: Ig-like domain-containing protein [Gammaproteobacteria bacterium]|nr:Ig-like domain-containing protein [Gammaproteobacteria bacterium]
MDGAPAAVGAPARRGPDGARPGGFRPELSGAWTPDLLGEGSPPHGTTPPSGFVTPVPPRENQVSRCRVLARLQAALAALALLGACGGSESPTTPPSAELSLSSQLSVAVRPRTPTLTRFGETVQLSAVVHDRSPSVVAVTEIRWTTSDKAVATVDVRGLVTAGSVNGTATVTAEVRVSSSLGGSSGSASGSAEVTVRRQVASVEVTPSAEIVYVGHTLPLSAEPLDGSGHAVTEAGFSWESSDNAVATVASMGSTGLVRGVAPGPVTITVTADSVEATVEITVVPDPERTVLSTLHIRTGGLSRSTTTTGSPVGGSETGPAWQRTIRTGSSRRNRRPASSRAGSPGTRRSRQPDGFG